MRISGRTYTSVTLAVSGAAVGLAYLLHPGFHTGVNQLVGVLSALDVEGLRAYLASFGIWAPAVSMGLLVLQAIVVPIPAAVITITNGLLFGALQGGLISLVGAMGAACLAYCLGRVLGRPAAEVLVGRRVLNRTDRFLHRHGRYAVLIARLIPVVPFDAVSYAAGLAGMRFRDFMWATLLGMLPATAVYSAIGEYTGRSWWMLLWVGAGILLILGVGGLARRWFRAARFPKAEERVAEARPPWGRPRKETSPGVRALLRAGSA